MDKIEARLAAVENAAIALAQRDEVDIVLISLLLDLLPAPEIALQGWRAKAADLYAKAAPRLLAEPAHQARHAALKERLAMWEAALQARSRGR